MRRLQVFYQFDPGVSLIDLGGCWPEPGSHFSRDGSLILVKTLNTEGCAGELRLFRREEVLGQNSTARPEATVSGVAEVLNVLGDPSFGDLVVVGLFSRSLTMRPRMTPEVEAAVPRATDRISSSNFAASVTRHAVAGRYRTLTYRSRGPKPSVEAIISPA